MTPLTQIEQDLDWRDSELAVLKILLANGDLPEREKLVLFRAAWALLYAHYEGFCKFALTVFYDSIKVSGKLTNQLPARMQVFALEKKIKLVKNLPAVDFINRITSFHAEDMRSEPEFPDVDTKSNLWSSVFEDLLCCASIEVASFSSSKRKIDTLVGKRNAIAHGEREIILDFDYYTVYHDAVRDVMYDLAISIDDRLRELS